MDENAINYNSEANTDDGSCRYIEFDDMGDTSSPISSEDEFKQKRPLIRAAFLKLFCSN